MAVQGFHENDFAVFSIPGLSERMAAIVARVRPKLTEIGQEMEPFLTALTGEPMYFHVAKHMRRTVNPPDDTWVAWSNNKRGYKAYPHFEMGLFSTHLYIQFAIVYESPHKAIMAAAMEKNPAAVLASVPKDFLWSLDSTMPMRQAHKLLRERDIREMAAKLRLGKRFDLVCGANVLKGSEEALDGDKLRNKIETVCETLLPLYRLAFS
ncbi:MAG TPA: DUF1054 domain-containing protein [Bacilli bacterium]